MSFDKEAKSKMLTIRFPEEEFFLLPPTKETGNTDLSAATAS